VQSLEADEVINLAVDHLLDQNPSDLSLEANISYMGVEDKRSDKFVKKREAAKDYLEMLEAKEVDHDVLAKLDWLLEEFSDDPVFVAKLKMKRLTKLGK
jgi:hypothetical protein